MVYPNLQKSSLSESPGISRKYSAIAAREHMPLRGACYLQGHRAVRDSQKKSAPSQKCGAWKKDRMCMAWRQSGVNRCLRAAYADFLPLSACLSPYGSGSDNSPFAIAPFLKTLQYYSMEKKKKRFWEKNKRFLFTFGEKLYIIEKSPGCGSVWLERTAGGREVAGSNPVTPISKRA